MANSATFRIHSVKCRDEMGGATREKFGNDEIKCAVFSGDLRGSAKNSGRINIYDNFDDKDVKRFDPPKEVVTLDLAGKTGEVELAFSVLLIESQLREGDGLNKAFAAFTAIYEEQVKEQLGKQQLPLTVAQARALARPGYLSRPVAGAAAVRAGNVGSLGGVAGRLGGTTGFRPANSPSHADADTETIVETPEEKKERESTADKLAGSFLAALIAAVALFAVKFAGQGIMALVEWSRDKFFEPVKINAKFDASAAPETVPPNASGVLEFRGHDGIYEMEWDILVR